MSQPFACAVASHHPAITAIRTEKRSTASPVDHPLGDADVACVLVVWPPEARTWCVFSTTSHAAKRRPYSCVLAVAVPALFLMLFARDISRKLGWRRVASHGGDGSRHPPMTLELEGDGVVEFSRLLTLCLTRNQRAPTTKQHAAELRKPTSVVLAAAMTPTADRKSR